MQVMCDPESCPLAQADKCPIGPLPNMPCTIRSAFIEEFNLQIARSFKDIDSNPNVKLRVNMMLRPLFEQLLDLRMAQSANSDALFGTKANPLMKEIRQVILAIDKVITETVRLYHDGPSKQSAALIARNAAGKDPLNMGGKSYYDMLIIDGNATVEERTGIDDNMATNE